MNELLAWLASLPPAALYAMLAVSAAIENIFPPVPADTVVAFGSFLAARGQGTAAGSFLATLTGNLLGASAMYWVGRRYGTGLLRKLGFGDPGKAEGRLKVMYGKYGLGALFLSRFIPGLRAIVPPFAGAARLPFLRAFVVMGIASAIWYAVITWLAFRVGSNWDELSRRIGSAGRVAAIVAAAALALAVVWWVLRRRRAEA